MKQKIRQILTILFIVGTCVSPAQAANYFADNTSIDNVVNPGRVQPIGEIEVVEFFWYGCPHCAEFEPELQTWVNGLPRTVKFVRLPASWNPDMVNQQRLYFTLEALNRLNLHTKVFNDIHKKRLRISTPAQIEKWAIAQKINASQWRSTYNSQAVSDRVAYAQEAYKRFELSWVPAIVVNGKRVVAFTPDILKNTEQAVQVELRHLETVAPHVQ